MRGVSYAAALAGVASGTGRRARSSIETGPAPNGGGGAATTLVAGYFSTENGAQNLLFDSLPPVVHTQLVEEPR